MSKRKVGGTPAPKLKAKGNFVPSAKLDPSQVVDRRNSPDTTSERIGTRRSQPKAAPSLPRRVVAR